jgi:hypothetical protein
MAASKAWVYAPNDNVGHEYAGGGFIAPLTLPVPPVKGSVVLSIENASTGDGQPTIDVAVYDGTTWQDLSTTWSLAASNQTPSFLWWCADRSHVDDGTFDPSGFTASAWAWAQADGIHILWNGQGSGTTADEHTLAYPAGVTQADMPASTSDLVPKPPPPVVTPPVVAAAGFDGSKVGGWYLNNIISHRGR